MTQRRRQPSSGRTRRPRRTGTAPTLGLVRGLVVIALLAGLTAVALRTPNGVPGRSYRTQYVDIPDVGNLQTHNDVRVAGVRVGQVLKATSQNGKAHLKLQLNSSVSALPTDTAAVVRSAGLLGQRYLELVPGTSQSSLAEGQTIRAAKNSLTLGVPEALLTFDRETRGALGHAVDGLGAGVAGRNRDINSALGVAPQAATEFRTLAGAVVANPSAAGSLLPSLSSAAAALDQSDKPLVDALAPTSAALTPFTTKRDAVRATLADLPPTLETARPALVQGRTLLTSLRHVATAVDRTLPDAPAALRDTAALLRQAPRPLRRTRTLLAQARTAVPATLRITRALAPVLTPLRQPLENLISPVSILGAHGCDIVNFGSNWRSFLGYGVPGLDKKFGPLGEIRAEALVTMPYAEAGPALRLPASMVDRDLYPAPCTFRSTPYSLIDPTK
jgi:phospholipid/cholesterol/gamma-HCH transport system substrate-binding protein